MKRYSKYKDSGIDWLGEIPEGWEVKKLKYLSPRICVGLVINPSTYFTEEGTVPFLLGNNIDEESFKLDNVQKITEESNEHLSSSMLFEGDLVTIRVGYPGVTAVVPKELHRANCGSMMIIRKSSRFVSGFLCKAINSIVGKYQIGTVIYGAAQKQFNIGDAVNFLLPVPPLAEQNAIACFIDRKLVQIDQFIRNKQRFIELLKEQKSAIVNRAVTKGLNPDAPMKPSGIEWLGDIPEGWEVERIGRLSESLQTGPFGSQLHSHEYVSGGIPVINPSNMKDSRIFPDFNCAIDNSTWERLKRHALKIGDIIFARRGEMGRCALVTQKEKGWICGTGSLRMRPKREKTISEFLIMVLSAKGVAEYLSLMSVGSTMENLNTGILQRLPLPIPPLDEQKRIIELIQKKSLQIDQAIAKAEKEIELIQEYRTTLISDAVTGKIDVSEITTIA